MLRRPKKNAHRESCELSFIWGKMRTIARETASQTALRNCSTEVGRGGQYISDFGDQGVPVAQHTFLQNVSASLMKVPATTRSRSHREGF